LDWDFGGARWYARAAADADSTNSIAQAPLSRSVAAVEVTARRTEFFMTLLSRFVGGSRLR
jgi:hypothetical protein